MMRVSGVMSCILGFREQQSVNCFVNVTLRASAFETFLYEIIYNANQLRPRRPGLGQGKYQKYLADALACKARTVGSESPLSI